VIGMLNRRGLGGTGLLRQLLSRGVMAAHQGGWPTMILWPSVLFRVAPPDTLDEEGMFPNPVVYAERRPLSAHRGERGKGGFQLHLNGPFSVQSLD